MESLGARIGILAIVICAVVFVIGLLIGTKAFRKLLCGVSFVVVWAWLFQNLPGPSIFPQRTAVHLGVHFYSLSNLSHFSSLDHFIGSHKACPFGGGIKLKPNETEVRFGPCLLTKRHTHQTGTRDSVRAKWTKGRTLVLFPLVSFFVSPVSLLVASCFPLGFFPSSLDP